MLQRQSIAQKLGSYLPKTPIRIEPKIEGKLVRVVGLTLEAVGCVVSLGDRCLVFDGDVKTLETEVEAGREGDTCCDEFISRGW
jgi:flagellum-specific ATP synthase